ncbi:MAG: polysaccharide deacetylase family protein [Oligoflexia bacterium]|nr:polysaccharide deacetylase family protein [Oligoflexia bacterium]
METWCDESWQLILSDVELLPDASIAFWWRDDDASEKTDQLEALTKVAEEFRFEVALATVPERLQSSLIQYVKEHPLLVVCQHGYRHENYEKGLGKGFAAELGDARDPKVVLKDLAEGKAIIEEEFAESFIPILVPPWNRIHEEIIPSLEGLGYVGLSTFGQQSQKRGELSIVDCHMDILKWKPTVHFRGAKKCLRDFREVLRERLDSGRFDSPIGILTHHLDHTDDANSFLRAFFSHLLKTKKFRYLTIREVFSKL